MRASLGEVGGKFLTLLTRPGNAKERNKLLPNTYSGHHAMTKRTEHFGAWKALGAYQAKSFHSKTLSFEHSIARQRAKLSNLAVNGVHASPAIRFQGQPTHFQLRPSTTSSANSSRSKYDDEILHLLEQKEYTGIEKILSELCEMSNNDTARLQLETFEKIVTRHPLRTNRKVAFSTSFCEYLVRLHHQGKLDSAPTEDLFCLILSAPNQRNQTGERAERLLDLYPFDPSIELYNGCLWHCAVAGDAKRHESILNKALRAVKNGNTKAKPTMFTWKSKLKFNISGEAAADLLKQMTTLYENGELDEPPDAQCYNMVITAYGRSEGPKKTEEMLEKMYQKSLNKTGPPPNVKSFNIVISTWLRSLTGSETTNEVGDRVDLILDHMYELHDKGILQELPESITFGAVMNTWRAIGNMEKVEQVFGKQLEAFYQGNAAAKPHNDNFSCLLKALLESDGEHLGERADSVLVQMLELNIPPTQELYHRILDCWKTDPGHPRYKTRCFQLMELIKGLRKRLA